MFKNFLAFSKTESIKPNNEKRRRITDVKQSISFRDITSEAIADENLIEYIPSTIDKQVFLTPYLTLAYAVENKYISLHTSNKGISSCLIEWYGKFDNSSRLILTNNSIFMSITNLSDILLEIVQLYKKYIHDDIFISSNDFAIRLIDEPCANYVGKASLVFTKNTIRNSFIEPEDIVYAKKFFINEFLDRFIGWNFGKIILNDHDLENELLDFNNYIISIGLRESIDDDDFLANLSKDVVLYHFPKK